MEWGFVFFSYFGVQHIRDCLVRSCGFSKRQSMSRKTLSTMSYSSRVGACHCQKLEQMASYHLAEEQDPDAPDHTEPNYEDWPKKAWPKGLAKGMTGCYRVPGTQTTAKASSYRISAVQLCLTILQC